MVACSSKKDPAKAGSWLIQQKSQPVAMGPGATVQMVTNLKYNATAGSVSSVHETMNLLSGKTKMQVIEYTED